MQTCTQSLSKSLLKWPCTTNPFLSPPIPFDMYLACHNLRLAFFPSHQRYRLSLEGSLMPFQPPFIMLLALFLLIFLLLVFSKPISSRYLLHLLFLTLHPSNLDPLIVCSVHSPYSFQQVLDIGQDILDAMTPYCNPSYKRCGLPFTLLISDLWECWIWD